MLEMKLHNSPKELHLLHSGLASSHYSYNQLSTGLLSAEDGQVHTLSLRSLQFRQPNLDLRIVLLSRISSGRTNTMYGRSANALHSLIVKISSTSPISA